MIIQVSVDILSTTARPATSYTSMDNIASELYDQ